jgi:hypothetical protein
MSTSTLELIELDVDLDQQIPCNLHTDTPATFRVNHPKPGNSCTFFICTPCADIVNKAIAEYTAHLKVCTSPRDHDLLCSHCEESVQAEEVHITSLGN